MGFRIRRAVAQDAAAVRRLVARSLLGHGPEVGHSERLGGRRSTGWSAPTGSPFAKGTYFVVEQGARVLGIGGLRSRGPAIRYSPGCATSMWIRSLARQGIGELAPHRGRRAGADRGIPQC